MLRAETGMFLPDLGAEPELFDMRGQRIPASFRRASGGWTLETAPAVSGLLLVR